MNAEKPVEVPVEESQSKPTWRQKATRLRRQGWRRLRGGKLTPKRAAMSVAFGLFLGSLPIYGLHLPLCLAVSLPLRLDAPATYIAANISNPFIAPWLLLIEIQAGSYLLTGQSAPFDTTAARETGIGSFATFAALGSVSVGLILAVIGGASAWTAAYAIQVKRHNRKEN